MPAPATIPDLLDLVRRSGLVAEQVLDNFLRQHRNELDGAPGQLMETLVNEGLLTCFQAEQLLLGKCRGFSIGKYKILERLGTGGMALVYLCEAPDQTRVAVKVLPNTRAQDMEYLKRFYREARVAAGLDHVNIVRTHDIDHDGKVNFMVMEYVEGTLLHDIVQDHGPMSVPRACHYMRQIAEGLQHAHEKGLIHRDIKPGNLILNRDGVAKILDMGLARNFADESEEVLTRGVLGTPDYLAPEQGQDSHNVDIRADIYSLGCSFYYLLSGAAPFGEGTIAQKLVWHQTKPPKPIRLFRPEVTEELAAVIHLKMLAKNPADRYQTPQEIADALVPFTKEPIPPPPEAEMPQLSLAARGVEDTAPDMARVTPPINSVATATQMPTKTAVTPAPAAKTPAAKAPPPKAPVPAKAPIPAPAASTVAKTPAAKGRPTTRGTPAPQPVPAAKAPAATPPASTRPSAVRRNSKVVVAPRPSESEPVPFATEDRPWLKWVLVGLVMLVGMVVLVVVLGWEQLRPLLMR